MDLFAGCGGITLGFVTAGFEPVASVELDPWAAASLGTNFSKFANRHNLAAHSKPRDILEEPAAIFRDLGLTGPVDDQVDVLVGGPPCQAFARVGRAKLRHEAHRREEKDAQMAHVVDRRVNLYERYLHYVSETKPLALLIENVPDMLNHGGRNLAEVVSGHLQTLSYHARYTLLNASWFGVPQTRERMFLLAFHESLDSEVLFPAPTHHCILPPGYEGTRATARKLVTTPRGAPYQAQHFHRWVDDPLKADGLPDATTTAAALADLPAIDARELLRSGRLRRGRKDPSEPTRYTRSTPSTPWSTLMRQWPEFSTADTTTGHVIRYLPRDYKIFNLMHEGWEYPEIWSFIEERRQRLLATRANNRSKAAATDAELKELARQWTLPYDPDKFPNKWWKLCRDKPARTLMAHLGKDGYSHIHFDSNQARTISVREAARLQSFPDGSRSC